MLKKLVGVAAILAICITVAVAETTKGKITKIDGDKVTLEVKDKKVTKSVEVNVKDAKVVEGKDKTPVADGVKALKVGQAVAVEHTDGKATEIILAKKKK